MLPSDWACHVPRPVSSSSAPCPGPQSCCGRGNTLLRCATRSPHQGVRRRPPWTSWRLMACVPHSPEPCRPAVIGPGAWAAALDDGLTGCGATGRMWRFPQEKAVVPVRRKFQRSVAGVSSGEISGGSGRVPVPTAWRLIRFAVQLAIVCSRNRCCGTESSNHVLSRQLSVTVA